MVWFDLKFKGVFVFFFFKFSTNISITKWGLSVFSLRPPNNFLSKMRRKLERGNLMAKWQKCPCTNCKWASEHCFSFFFFLFYPFSLLGVCLFSMLPLFLFFFLLFFFSFDFLGLWHCTLFCFHFCFFFFV